MTLSKLSQTVLFLQRRKPMSWNQKNLWQETLHRRNNIIFILAGGAVAADGWFYSDEIPNVWVITLHDTSFLNADFFLLYDDWDASISVVLIPFLLLDSKNFVRRNFYRTKSHSLRYFRLYIWKSCKIVTLLRKRL